MPSIVTSFAEATARQERLCIDHLDITLDWPLAYADQCLPTGHSAKENDQDADGDNGERRAGEELRRPIETLATP